ncbi:hypothetical protein [Tenacibaculum mesophilum]|uniref:hypothetical protein n=1 Tax=Tenacibaculum mesophilum TaxID=104268 RepID=UPI003F60699D
MKKRKIVLGFLIVVFGLVACNKNQPLKLLADSKLSPDEFFSKVSALDIQTSNDENVIYIDVEYDKKNNTIKYLSSVEAEADFFVLDSEEEIQKRIDKGTYEVTCKGATGEFTESCEGKVSCGKLIYECLQAGGCATICQNKIVYVPQNRTFYIE